MRILLTTDTVGGVWTFTKELATGLLQAGHDVALVSFGRAPSQDQSAWYSSTLEVYGGAFRYDASSAPLEWMQNNNAAYEAAEPLLLRVADTFSPHIFHSSQFCFGRLPLAVPKIITAHSDVLSWAEACRPAGLEPSEWLTKYRELVQQGLDRANAVVAPTRWMLHELEKNFRTLCAKHVVLNGRSLTVADRPEKRELQAVSAGRLWDEAKNFNLLSQVRTPFPILIAGDLHHDGVSIPALPSEVTFSGRLSEDDLLALFRASSLYLALSIYEPFGLAPLEAALCGCAVLANDIPSLREVWGEAVLYFDNAETLRRALTGLQDSPKQLHRLRESAMRRALELTRSRMVESYLRLYRQHSQFKTPVQEQLTYA